MKTHSKCSICAHGDTMLERLRGNNTEWAVTERERIRRVLAEHEEHHLSARTVLDDAGLAAITNPKRQWTIIVDAATQRNFQLPKLSKRMPKSPNFCSNKLR